MDTKRYDVGGKTVAGRGYPEGTILKLTDPQAKALGLGDGDVSSMTTTADDAPVARGYDEAMVAQDEMRAAELARVEEAAAAAETEDVPGTKRTRKPKEA